MAGSRGHMEAEEPADSAGTRQIVKLEVLLVPEPDTYSKSGKSRKYSRRRHHFTKNTNQATQNEQDKQAVSNQQAISHASEPLSHHKKKKRQGWKKRTMDFSTGIDDIYYKNTCLWDPVKVKAKLMSLEGKIDTASRERTRRAMLEDARSYALRQRQVDATADHGDNSSCTSDGGKYGVMLSKYVPKPCTDYVVCQHPWIIDMAVKQAQRKNVVGIIGTQNVEGIEIPYGVDHWGDVLELRHPSFGPPMGHYWRNTVHHVDALVCETKSPRNFYLQNYETKTDLEMLVLSMKAWYDVFWPTSPLLRRSEVVIGGFYAAYVEKYDHWYRCTVDEVICLPGGEFDVVINLIDYGCVEVVGHDGILFLRERYCSLPRQAARGSIYGVEQDFSEDVIEQFKADVDLKAFQLYIVERNCDLSLLYPALSVFLIYVDDNKIDCVYTMSGRLELEIPPEALAYSADDEAEDQWSENMMN